MNRQIIVWLILGVTIVSCEIPDKPDFTTSHKVEAPVMYNKTFQFMGDSTAIVDTTSADFDSLFSVDGDNFITISKEEDFEFGDMNDAIPVIDVDPTSFESEVGEIELTDFSSSDGDLGSADIQEVTGQDPNSVPTGTPIPAGDNSASPVRLAIGANTDFFRSATIKDGRLNIELTNTLGFDFETTEIQVIDTVTNNAVGSTAVFSAANGNQLTDNDTETAAIIFSEGDQLINLGVRIVVSWNSFNFPSDPGALTVNSVVGDGLIASQVQAALDAQDFSSSSTATFNADEFEFTDPDHFVKLASGEIEIAPIQNDLEFSIDLTITFADIKSCQSSLVSDIPEVINHNPLTIEYSRTNNTEISRGGSSNSVTVSLAECELFATNNEVTYTIDAATENTKNAPQGDRIRVINEAQSVNSSVEISNLVIARATGIIKQQIVLLNEDEGEDEELSLFNDNEAEITEIDGLSDLSNRLENLNLTNPSLSINYSTNISVPTTIYGAFVGTNGKGERVYLKGEGVSSEYLVQNGDPISGLNKEVGQPLNPDEMIKFSLAENLDGNSINASIEFNRDNTNVDDFLNNLPSDIRFIGKAVINEEEDAATIIDPLEFDPKISIDIPLAFETTEAATFTDTTEQDFSDVPSSELGDSRSITAGKIIIDYSNGLPLGVDLKIGFLDSLSNEFTSLPDLGETILLESSSIDQVTRFSDPNNPSQGSITIALNKSQFDQLYKTKNLKVTAGLITFENSEIKLRTTDSITLTVSVELTIESEVN